MHDRRSSSRNVQQGNAATPSLQELSRALRLPDAYPHRPGRVDVEQTQMSLVFLAGEFVYKLKKPVNLGYLDYSTLEARRFFCQKEVELNRRLCADAYLGVVHIVHEGERLLVEGEGNPVEYAVKMRRLPAERMLDRLLHERNATPETMQRIADRVARFHMSGNTDPEISQYGSVAVIKGNTDENFDQTRPYIGRTITAKDHSYINDYTDAFLDTRGDVFTARVREGRILDCHGDLHAAHVCMTDDVCIYDCIEFNDRFRYGDTASEVAFLAMDLDRFSRRDLSRVFVESYIEATGDSGLIGLLDFYKCYRAFVRGKVEGFRAADEMASQEDQDAAVWRARHYFQLALEYARGKGSLILMSGLSGSGKSRIAAEVAERLGFTIIASDVVRKRLAGLSPEETRHEPFGEGLYAEEWTRRTYDEIVRQGKHAIERGHSALLDASFLQRWQREKAISMAHESGVRPVIAECTAPYETLRERLTTRTSISDARPEILDQQRGSEEPIDGTGDVEHAILDTRAPLTNTVEELWTHL